MLRGRFETRSAAACLPSYLCMMPPNRLCCGRSCVGVRPDDKFRNGLLVVTVVQGMSDASSSAGADMKAHWDRVSAASLPTDVSWFQQRLATSLSLIQKAVPSPEARIIDVGGGASTLVDSLLELGYRNITVLDLAPTAIGQGKSRLGDRAAKVNWLEADITTCRLPQAYDVWHDRAVFHFLTDREVQERYVTSLRRSLKQDGQAVIATFGPTGPNRCSGLPVVRYGPGELQQTLGRRFRLLECREEEHVTPRGRTQDFMYFRLEHV